MGKTGTTAWAQIKGVKGKIRLVPKKEGQAKTPAQTSDSKQAQTSSRLTQWQKQCRGAEANARVAGAGAAGATGPAAPV